MQRRKTQQVKITDKLSIGSEHPIAVQSMTNTPTANIGATIEQVKELFLAGSSMVRITVNDDDAAKAVSKIDAELRSQGLEVPLVGDFHYNGHLLLEKHPDCASTLAKYRINPGNVGFGEKHDSNFAKIIQIAIAHNKPVRIGVNWGSLDQELFTQMMDENAKEKEPLSSKEIIYKAMTHSALSSAEYAQKLGLKKDRIIISVKMSEVQDLISVYRKIANLCDYPLHLGLTEAGSPVKGMISSSVAMGILLQEGIGDTIRMSLTPQSQKDNILSDRTLEVIACQNLLQSMGIEFFKPQVTSCPGCGRTSSDYFQRLAEDINSHIENKMPEWQKTYPGVEKLKIAVMGCIVNGPGESKHADIGISLPGDNEEPSAPVYIEGAHKLTLRGDKVASEFKDLLETYIKDKYSKTAV